MRDIETIRELLLKDQLRSRRMDLLPTAYAVKLTRLPRRKQEADS
jgi:hypothetical protein